MVDVVVVVVVIGWLVSYLTAIFIVPKLAAGRVCRQFGLSQVKVKGEKFYVPEGPDGEPVKVPIGIKKDDEGNDVVELGYAPLAYSLPFMVADMAALKVKMALLGAKGNVSKALGKQMLEGMAKGEVALDAAMPFLPKKLAGALAVARALGLNLNGGNGGNGNVPQQTQKAGGWKV